MRAISVFTIAIIVSLFMVGCGSTQAPATPVPPTSTPAASANVETDTSDGQITFTFATFVDDGHAYYLELLQKSLEAAGHQVEFDLIEDLPQKRAVQMLDDSELTIFWMVQSAERDEKYVPIEVGVTNNLIGHRIFLIPEGQNEVYSRVNDLDDLKALGKVGGFGKGWFDVNVWQQNDLPYKEVDGEWRNIYSMMAKGDRGIDYFSRGFNEIVSEAEANPELEIEERLMLIYDRDFRFYLSVENAEHKEMVEDALKQAKKSGLMDQLIREYWAEDFDTLKFDERTKIKLDTPS